MIQGMREPIEFRQPAPVRIYFVCFALLWVGSLVAFGIRSPSDALITVLMSAIGVAFIIRIWSVKFVADESGLVVRNFFRTLRLGWGEVEDFRLGTMMGMPFGRVVHVLLRNGEVVTLDITASHWTFVFGGRAKQELMLQRLREWLPRED
jgi:Bacterial PH domain